MTKLTSRVIKVNQRHTSMRLCCKEWSALDEVCAREQISRSDLFSLIENNKNDKLGLAYATRLFLLLYYQSLAMPSKHKHAAAIIKELA